VSVRVTSLFVHPVKSCRGIRVERAALVERGLEYDRRWMIVDAAGRFVTQRERPRLALVATSIRGTALRLAAPEVDALELPLALAGGERRRVQVWRHEGEALVHPGGSRFFTRLLGAPHELVYMPEDERRQVNPAYARPEDLVGFQDGYPLLLISEESLADLNARLRTPLEMERFRPNVVVSGCAPYAEDRFTRFSIGGVGFRAVKRCDRCAVTTVDPRTAETGPEPLATLATYRRQEGKVWFGMNVLHDGQGELRVGDALEGAESAP
jgi:uncharacterized protein YcbX